MSKLMSFVLGVAIAVVLVGGVGAWILIGDKAVTKSTDGPASPMGALALPSTDKVPDGAAVPNAAAVAAAAADDNATFSVEGTVSVPPLLKKFLATKKDAVILVQAYLGNPTGSADILEQNLAKPISRFPHTFQSPVAKGWTWSLRNHDDVLLFVRALICYDRAKDDERCLPGTPGAKMIGWTRVRVSAVPMAGGKELVFKMPATVINRNESVVSADKCHQSGNTLGGLIQATASFLAQPGHPQKFVFLAIPAGRDQIHPPYIKGQDPRPLTDADLSAMSEQGILSQSVTISGSKSEPISLKVPASSESYHYFPYLVACQDGDSEKACAARAFPISLLASSLEQGPSLYKLMPEGFELPSCGSKSQKFYLHHWKSAGIATDATVQAANPPELIEGASF